MSWRANLGAIYAAAAVSLAGPIAAQPAPSGQWTPTAQMVAQLEKAIRLPQDLRMPRDRSLADYDRYYTGSEIGGRKVISGLYVQIEMTDARRKPNSVPAGQVHIVPMQRLPTIADGGCSVITVFYDLKSGSATIQCNGYG
jgi:hypothetical protein